MVNSPDTQKSAVQLTSMLDTIEEFISRTSVGDWLVFTAGVLFLLYALGTWNYHYFLKRSIMSTRPQVPFVGDFFGAFTGRKSFPDIILELYNRGFTQDIFGAFEFMKPIYMIREPEILKLIAVKEFENFMNHRNFGNGKTDPIFDKNLVNLNDQPWKNMRATLSPAFTTSKIKAMLPLISDCVEQLSHHLLKMYTSSKEGNMKTPLEVDMKDIFTRLTNDVIATTAFGVSCDSLNQKDNEFYLMGKKLTNFDGLRSLKFFATLAFPKFMELIGVKVLDAEATKFFHTLVHETIRERQKKGIFRPDMLQLLMQAREGKLKMETEDQDETEKISGKETQLTDEDISSQAIIFFFGGFETVSSALCLTCHVLSHHPDVQKRLQKEIAQVMQETGGKPSYETVQAMKYLDAVVNETFRLYPPNAGTDRVCQKDIKVTTGALYIPVVISKGALINVPIIGLHRDPEYWPNPEKFDPERFSDENKHKIKPFTYMPFGLGPRFCIGQRFALIEVKMALIHLMHHFDLHPCAKTAQPIEFLPGATLKVRGGFWCGITPKEA